MSTLTYQHSLSGKGVGAGLPLRRASKLYHHEPNLVYPNAFSTGLDSDQHAYSKQIYLRTPHLPVTRIVEPYIANNGKTFTRRQFFVIKRGQPLMAADRRAKAIGYFKADGSVGYREYLNPEKMGGRGTLVGYSNDGGATTITVDAFKALTDEQKTEYRPVYEGLEDTNDKIPTGGIDQRYDIEEAILGSTSLVKYVEVDADSFYFGAAHHADGFIFPSTGGVPRTIWFNEVDQEAGVMLPTDGTNNKPRIVTPLGNTTDVTVANAANWKDSGVVVEALPTVGFAHTDLEQATSHRWHMFQTGLEPHSPMRKGTHMIPFVDVKALDAYIEEKAGNVGFSFTDTSNKKSGLKVGVSGVPASIQIDVQNRYSLLTEADRGYANLYYNFGAPFVTLTSRPKIHQKLQPDLFGNFVPAKSGYFASDATLADAAADFGLDPVSNPLTEDVLNANKDGATSFGDDHICGRVIGIYDMPVQNMLKYVVNNQHQLRQHTDWVSEGYTRVRSADTAGLEPILADFALMLLGGSAYEWASNFLPVWDNRRQDIAYIIEDLVIKGVIGIVEIAADVMG